MKTLSLKTVAFALVMLSPALPVLAEDAKPAAAAAAPSGAFVSGVHSPITHIYEVTNAAVLRASTPSSVNGTLAERPAADHPVHTAMAGK